MATVYSLVCWGGRDGKSVTVSSTTDYVTSTLHGCRNGMAVCFASGTLPTVASGDALAVGTTYYAKEISDNTFELYREVGLATKINFTSNGSSLVMQSAYRYALTTDEKARYGSAGSERIYDGLVSWNSGRSGASNLDEEVCELGESYIDKKNSTSALDINVPAARFKITSLVNGVRSAAFHGGVVGSGYVFAHWQNSGQNMILTTDFSTLDGFEISLISSAYSGYPSVTMSGFEQTLSKMIINSNNTGAYGVLLGGGSRCVNTLALKCNNYGFRLSTYTPGQRIEHCTAVKCFGAESGISAYTPGSNSSGKVTNCVALGNTGSGGNWAPPTWGGTIYGINNAGGTGEAWSYPGTTRIVITESSPFSATFADFTNNDFRPASGSALIDAGADFYGIEADDITDAERPSYNNGGSEGYDIGAFEFDRGYGPAPTTVNVTITGLVTGSRVYIERTSDAYSVMNQTESSGTATTTYTYTGDVAVTVSVRLAGYQEWTASATITINGLSLIAGQYADSTY